MKIYTFIAFLFFLSFLFTEDISFISNIKFYGNESISRSELLSIIKMKPPKFFSRSQFTKKKNKKR